jgi:DNA-binding CsgD family transcriptional regulator
MRRHGNQPTGSPFGLGKQWRLMPSKAGSMTPTQANVASLIRLGKCSKEIAETLGVSIKTI